jgi:hypothetical protein
VENETLRILVTLLFIALGLTTGPIIADCVWTASITGTAFRSLAFFLASGFPLAIVAARNRRRKRMQETHRATVLATALRNGALDYWVFPHPLLPAPEEPDCIAVQHKMLPAPEKPGCTAVQRRCAADAAIY